jgi:hypothetical protein
MPHQPKFGIHNPKSPTKTRICCQSGSNPKLPQTKNPVSLSPRIPVDNRSAKANIMQKYWLAAILVGSLACATRVQGQSIPVPFDGLAFQLMTTNQFNNVLEANLEKPKSSNPATPPTNLQALSFRVSSTDRQQNITRFITNLRATDPAAADNWAQVFATNDVFGAIDQAMGQLGLDSTNLADAYAVYWTNAWLGAQGRTDDLPSAQLIAVRNQAAQALLATPQVIAATDAQKQEIAEGLLIQAALIDASVKQAQGDPTLLPQVQTAIKQGAQTIGLNLDRFSLTDRGFTLTQ